ncbi:unnamed protein product [Polarella glacialis]|uniref:Secreted protein n=1 Tax=Polarella glacialis TaxID=89957 RepID=A0A813KYZ3_POLGL|nr:unnamed protein product [Polarella glacialis]
MRWTFCFCSSPSSVTILAACTSCAAITRTHPWAPSTGLRQSWRASSVQAVLVEHSSATW